MMDHEELPPPPELPAWWDAGGHGNVETDALRHIARQLAWITMYLYGGPAGVASPPAREASDE